MDVFGIPASEKEQAQEDRKSTRLNSSHGYISYAVFCLKKKNNTRCATSLDPTFKPRSNYIRIYLILCPLLLTLSRSCRLSWNHRILDTTSLRHASVQLF